MARLAASAGGPTAYPERVKMAAAANEPAPPVEVVTMTAKHSAPRPKPIAQRAAPVDRPRVSAHLTVLLHPDGSLSWHVGVLDQASFRMTFPYAGTASLDHADQVGVIEALSLAMQEAIELDSLMF